MVAAEVVVLEVELESSGLVEADIEEVAAVVIVVAVAAEMIAVAGGSRSAVAAVVGFGSLAEARSQESLSTGLAGSVVHSQWAAVQTVTAVGVVAGNY